MSWPESIQLNALAADLELSQNHVDAAIARLESIAQKAQRPEFWKFKQVEVLVAADRGEEALNRLRNLDKQLEIQLKQPDGRSLRVLNAKVQSLLRELEKTEADSRP